MAQGKEPAFVSDGVSMPSLPVPSKVSTTTHSRLAANSADNVDTAITDEKRISAQRSSTTAAAPEKATFDDAQTEKIHRAGVRDNVEHILADANNFAHEFNTSSFAGNYSRNKDIADPDNQIDVRSIFRNTVNRTGNDCSALVKDMIYAFDSYEHFLDVQVTPVDRYFVNDENILHSLVQHGIRGSGQPMSADQFQRTKQHEKERYEMHRRLTAQQRNIGQLYSADFMADKVRWKSEPILRALAEREERNRTGDLRTVIFVRTNNDEGQEVSGYIDYSASLYASSDNWRKIFAGERRIVPRKSDISYYNWHTGVVCNNSTRNFKTFIPPDDPMKMMLLCLDDRQVVPVGASTKKALDRNAKTERIEFDTMTTVSEDDERQYMQVILYDHPNRAFFNRPQSEKGSTKKSPSDKTDDILADGNINTGAHYEKKVPVLGVHLAGKASQFGKAGKKVKK